MRPNNSFKPNLLRSGKNMAEKACHVFTSTTQVGLIQALGDMGQRSARAILCATIGLALLAACADAWLYHRDGIGAERLTLAWTLTFSLLVALWIEADSRRFTNVYRPYEYGFLVYLMWPVYLPYYLVRTRGARGIAWLTGFVVLYLVTWLARMVVWLVA